MIFWYMNRSDMIEVDKFPKHISLVITFHPTSIHNNYSAYSGHHIMVLRLLLFRTGGVGSGKGIEDQATPDFFILPVEESSSACCQICPGAANSQAYNPIVHGLRTCKTSSPKAPNKVQHQDEKGFDGPAQLASCQTMLLACLHGPGLAWIPLPHGK